MKVYRFTAVFIPERGRRGVYNVAVPALPGCLSFGESLQEAQYNIKEATELYLSTLLEEGLSIPRDKQGRAPQNAQKEELVVGIDYDVKAGFAKKPAVQHAK